MIFSNGLLSSTTLKVNRQIHSTWCFNFQIWINDLMINFFIGTNKNWLKYLQYRSIYPALYITDCDTRTISWSAVQCNSVQFWSRVRFRVRILLGTLQYTIHIWYKIPYTVYCDTTINTQYDIIPRIIREIESNWKELFHTKIYHVL